MKLTTAVARERFEQARVARLATVSGGGAPHLVPVTFAVIDPMEVDPAIDAGLIVFAVDPQPKSTSALRRLHPLAANPLVCFLVDHYADDWDLLWWCRADAVAAVLDGDVRTLAIDALRSKYPQYEQRPPTGVVVGCAVTGWSGWRAAA